MVDSMLDAHRLRVFRAVVAAGSINGAATNLGLTPSAVSQQVTALQRETGLTLLDKRGRGIVPTEVGRMVADESGAVLDLLTQLENRLTDIRSGRVGRLSVSYFASAGAAWIPPIVAQLMPEFPGLRIDLRLIELIHDADPDPDVEIFVDGAASSSLRDYDIHPLLTESYVVVLPADHALADQAEVSLPDLQHEIWVDNDVARGACRQSVIEAATAAGFAPTFGVETHDYPTAIRFVATGVGITVLPRLGVGELPPGLVARDVVDPTPLRHISVRTRSRLREHAAVQRIVELLTAQANSIS